jgi:hypothetical protein
MSRTAAELALRLTAAGIQPAVLAPAVMDMAAARAEAVNIEGLRAQIEYLLEAYGPTEIERMATQVQRK